MNKKAVFFSLSVVLFLLFLLIIFNNQSKIKEGEVKSYAERAQLIVMDNFVKDFDQYYIEQILETAAKHALVKRSGEPTKFNKEKLVDIMEDGKEGLDMIMEYEKSTENNFNQALGTLAFTIPNDDRYFLYSIYSISQPSFDTIKIKFLVDYSFTVFDTTWSKEDKSIKVEFPVMGITHPSYSQVIDDSWVEDDCAIDCLLSDLMSDFDPGFCSVKNIIPSYLVVSPCP